MPPDLSVTSQRKMCERCVRAARACICHCALTVESVIEVVILQHPEETRHIKGSARLLHLCLPNSVLLIGERFEEQVLREHLFQASQQTHLLYPIPETEIQGVTAAPPTMSRARQTLVLLDATWRKSRQMLDQNPLLRTLPRIALRETPMSRYTIRQAHQPDQLSSLEACAYALMQLEKNDKQFQPLLTAFEHFNQLQIAFGVNKLLRV